jgi:hypothetical protein
VCAFGINGKVREKVKSKGKTILASKHHPVKMYSGHRSEASGILKP